MKLLGAGIKAVSAGSRAMEKVESLHEEKDEEKAAKQMQQTFDDGLPAFLEFAWAVNKVRSHLVSSRRAVNDYSFFVVLPFVTNIQRDIQGTLKEACKKLLQDAGVPKEERLVRAEAIRILGKEFHEVGTMATKSSKQDAEDIKARVAVASMATMAKAQGQEMTQQDQEAMMQHAKEQMIGGSKSSDSPEAK